MCTYFGNILKSFQDRIISSFFLSSKWYVSYWYITKFINRLLLLQYVKRWFLILESDGILVEWTITCWLVRVRLTDYEDARSPALTKHCRRFKVLPAQHLNGAVLQFFAQQVGVVLCREKLWKGHIGKSVLRAIHYHDWCSWQLDYHQPESDG